MERSAASPIYIYIHDIHIFKRMVQYRRLCFQALRNDMPRIRELFVRCLDTSFASHIVECMQLQCAPLLEHFDALELDLSGAALFREVPLQLRSMRISSCDFLVTSQLLQAPLLETFELLHSSLSQPMELFALLCQKPHLTSLSLTNIFDWPPSTGETLPAFQFKHLRSLLVADEVSVVVQTMRCVHIPPSSDLELRCLVDASDGAPGWEECISMNAPQLRQIASDHVSRAIASGGCGFTLTLPSSQDLPGRVHVSIAWFNEGGIDPLAISRLLEIMPALQTVRMLEIRHPGLGDGQQWPRIAQQVPQTEQIHVEGQATYGLAEALDASSSEDMFPQLKSIHIEHTSFEANAAPPETDSDAIDAQPSKHLHWKPLVDILVDGLYRRAAAGNQVHLVLRNCGISRETVVVLRHRVGEGVVDWDEHEA
ncbi:hypothetical protein BV25DRAFT_1838357 [Artomyces pyxidatus]|uniref:Uncharacterized protein n=1 Tax=Artomyces pyxidatus TaxID=48021 RepID=A0ACB8T1Z7_9AGAM|nr:hypothetical protein BV25DRAFT_1838357 [Artomyces pyxidatus]